jgi:anaerobic selenocysteine-containing dehydrogenase
VPQEPLTGGSRPALLQHVAAAASAPPPVDSYGFRLVATRKLYDLGTHVQASPSLAGLLPGTQVAINPYDFDRLGVAAGDRVTLRSARHSLVLPVLADAGVPRGAVALVLRQPEVRVTDLIDAGERVVELRIETDR